MTKNKTTLEVIAPTVEEAIEKGLEQLGVERKDVEVEVLDEGKRNLFRFASKQARIKLTVLENNNEVKVEAIVPYPACYRQGDPEREHKGEQPLRVKIKRR